MGWQVRDIERCQAACCDDKSTKNRCSQYETKRGLKVVVLTNFLASASISLLQTAWRGGFGGCSTFL